MDDRKLLEMAAKAAGLKIDKSTCSGGGGKNTGFDLVGNVVLDWHNGETWNPLTDDGDALRLSVYCSIEIRFPDDGWTVMAMGDGCFAEEKATMGYALEEATRRAIVRAAAEIGRQK